MARAFKTYDEKEECVRNRTTWEICAYLGGQY